METGEIWNSCCEQLENRTAEQWDPIEILEKISWAWTRNYWYFPLEFAFNQVDAEQLEVQKPKSKVELPDLVFTEK